MKAQPYSLDFPNLVRIPTASYIDTLENEGKAPVEAMIHLLVLDAFVKLVVKAADLKLGFKAPENIFVEDVADAFGCQLSEERDPEIIASIHKATLVARGEMEPNPIWENAA